MACSREAPCGGVLVEDFVILRAQIGFRFVRCSNGHGYKIDDPPCQAKRSKPGRAMVAICRGCGVEFSRVPLSRKAGRVPTCCSRACGHDVAAATRAKLDPASVARLYVERHWTLMRIAAHFGLKHHEAVMTALRRAGVTPRRHTSTRQCREAACRQPVDAQVDRAKHGSTRCRQHRMARERARSLRWWRAHHQVVKPRVAA